jgi:hypothetical protein
MEVLYTTAGSSRGEARSGGVPAADNLDSAAALCPRAAATRAKLPVTLTVG